MKIFTITLATFALMKFSFAQINLIPNYSFEEYTQCPDGEDQVPYATGWENWEGTPDYFNACSTSGFATVPYSLGAGNFQYARSGNAYCGLRSFISKTQLFGNPYVREEIAVQLLQPMQVGETYFLVMYVSLGSWIPSPCACNKLGVKFTMQSFASYGNIATSPLVNNYAPIYVDSMITDTMNWVQVSRSFIADSAYQYMVIGNFFDDAHTDTSIIGTSPICISYYFIDDVCLSTDSLGCFATGIQDLNAHEEIRVSPNPFNDQCTIKLASWNSGDIELKLTDEFGRLKDVNYNSFLQSNKTTLTIYKGNLEKGTYFLFVTAGSKQAVIPLIIQ